MKSEQILSEADIEELTGSSQPKLQEQILRKSGVWYLKRRDGRLRTTWHHVNHPITDSVKAISFDDYPNLQAI
ncbi:DUF4224 domain-containing protein [Neptunomonas phycophila]|mgnify:CR=1 FL=1|nr:DUF4224 domain-containing protein [Neptunomonas phycophila]MDO6466770.1 DUF4224 domain-containing protein [Neptunomonas phycophila]